jgi:hypothetical protein
MPKQADTVSPSASEDPLLFRIREKKQLPVRAVQPVASLLDAVRHRAGETGCGDVSRDELVAALLVAGSRASDDELHDWVEAYRRTRLSDLP